MHRAVVSIILICLVLASLAMFISVVADYFTFSFSGEKAEEQKQDFTVTAPPTPVPTPTPKPIPEDVKRMMEYIPYAASEMSGRPGMFGRLLFPDTGISVALFTDGAGETVAEKRQGICDAEDSAVLYYDVEGAVIADHNTQSFHALSDVLIGHKAYIITANSVLELICSRLIDGHNNDHKGIVDENYEPLHDEGGFICYTCMENWLDVRIVVLDIIDEYSQK